MSPIRIFISSVQQEFASERKALAEYIRTDALLGRFFEVFIFEEMPAKSLCAVQVYLGEVEQADIYLALLGANYGYEDAEGISPTERELDLATQLHKDRLIFIKRMEREKRHEKEACFIKKAEQCVVRKSFGDYEELRSAVYASLVRYLEENALSSEKNALCSTEKAPSSTENAPSSSIKLNKKQKMVLDYCTVYARTSNEIFTHLGITNQSRSREKYITQLILAGLLRPTKSKSTDPDQKYIATAGSENVNDNND